MSVLGGLSSRLSALGALLDSSNRDGGSCSLGAVATAALATALATVDEDLVQRLVKLARHFDEWVLQRGAMRYDESQKLGAKADVAPRLFVPGKGARRRVINERR